MWYNYVRYDLMTHIHIYLPRYMHTSGLCSRVNYKLSGGVGRQKGGEIGNWALHDSSKCNENEAPEDTNKNPIQLGSRGLPCFLTEFIL